MREGFEKKDNKKSKLGLIASAAMLAGVSVSAEAAGVKPSLEIKDAKQITSIDHASAWFEKSIAQASSLEEKELAKVESAVEQGSVPLRLQIRFLEEALKTNGKYFNELGDRRLSPQRISQIYKLTNMVSARLTGAYEIERTNPALAKYFKDVDGLRNATSRYNAKYQNGTSQPCNEFAVQDNEEVFKITAYHCVRGTVMEKEYFHLPVSDVAVKYIAAEDYGAMNIHDPKTLPTVNHAATPEQANGRVITAFSYGPDGKENIHFSFSMPLPANKFYIFSPGDIEMFSSLGGNNFSMFFKPFGEGQINPETQRTNAAGSSGGPISVRGLGILGSYTATKKIEDNRGGISYAASLYTRPDVFLKAIDAARAAHRTLAKL